MTYTEAVDILTSDETANMLDEMADSRRQEKVDLGNEEEELSKEHGQAKNGAKLRSISVLRKFMPG